MFDFSALQKELGLISNIKIKPKYHESNPTPCMDQVPEIKHKWADTRKEPLGHKINLHCHDNHKM